MRVARLPDRAAPLCVSDDAAPALSTPARGRASAPRLSVACGARNPPPPAGYASPSASPGRSLGVRLTGRGVRTPAPVAPHSPRNCRDRARRWVPLHTGANRSRQASPHHMDSSRCTAAARRMDINGERSRAGAEVMYELFDTETANLVDWFDNLAAALASVRQTIAASGEVAVASWALISQDPTEEPLRGDELVRRALQTIAI